MPNICGMLFMDDTLFNKAHDLCLLDFWKTSAQSHSIALNKCYLAFLSLRNNVFNPLLLSSHNLTYHFATF